MSHTRRVALSVAGALSSTAPPAIAARPARRRSFLSRPIRLSGLLQDDHVPVGIAQDGLGRPRLDLGRRIELHAF